MERNTAIHALVVVFTSKSPYSCYVESGIQELIAVEPAAAAA
jgi:hypothetical protein